MLENTKLAIQRTIQRNWQHRVHKTQDNKMLQNTNGTINKDNPEKLATYIGYTRHMTNKCYRIPTGLKEKDNPEKRAT
jgi:hypothetical protein